MTNAARVIRSDDQPESRQKTASTANTAVSLVGTIFGLAISVVSADFLRPFLDKLPKLLLGVFTAGFLISLAVTKIRRRPTHWLTYALACGVIFAVAVLLLSRLYTPAGKQSVGGLSAAIPDVRRAQAKLPLPPAARATIAALDNRSETPAFPAAQAPAQAPVVGRQDPGQLLLAGLASSLSSPDSQTRESAAENAVAQSQSSPATFRAVLRVLYRTKDPVLQEIAILHELKSLEGKQIPLTLEGASGSNGDGVAAPSDTAQQLSTLLVGTSVTVARVDLNSSSFTGSFNSDNRYSLNGSITSRGVQFTARVGYPYRENFPLQVTLHPSGELQLTGAATVTLKPGPASTPVALDLPF